MDCPSPRSRAAVLAACALLSACGTEPRGPSVVPSLLADPDRHQVHIGLTDPSSPNEALGWVTAARITSGGHHVVVLDFVSPFVKVYEHDGRLRTAFLKEGDGPGEARRPAALAVAGDSLILVADRGRGLSLFDLDGRLKEHANVPGLMPLAVAQPCPGEWLVYGPRAGGSTSREVRWLHRVRFTGTGAEVTSLLPAPLEPTVPVGLAYGLVPDGAGALVRHTLGERPRLLRWQCGGDSVHVVHEGEPLAQAKVVTDGANRRRTSVPPGTRAPAGLAALPGAIAFGENLSLGSHRSRTDLTLLAGGKERRLSVPGIYVIQDSRPDVGVLVSTTDPVPQVFLVRAADFQGMFPPP